MRGLDGIAQINGQRAAELRAERAATIKAAAKPETVEPATIKATAPRVEITETIERAA